MNNMTPEKILGAQNLWNMGKYVYYHTEKKLMHHPVYKVGYKSFWHTLFGDKAWVELNHLATQDTKEPFVINNNWIIIAPLKNPDVYQTYLSETQRHIAFVRNPLQKVYSGLTQENRMHMDSPYVRHRPLLHDFSDISVSKLLNMPDDVFAHQYLFALLVSSHCTPQFYYVEDLQDTYIPVGTELYDLSTMSSVMAELFPEHEQYAERALTIKNTTAGDPLKEVFQYKLEQALKKDQDLKGYLRSWVACDYERLLADPRVSHLAKD